jgi:hypothetical protein
MAGYLARPPIPKFPVGFGPGGTKIIVAGVVLWLATLAAPLAGLTDWAQWQGGQLLGWMLPLTIAIGSLFWVVIQHLTQSGWSVAVRRLAEASAAGIPFLAVGFVVIAVSPWLGENSLFHWAHPTAAEDHLIHHKAPYLNAPFFTLRLFVYFGVWGYLARFFFRNSVKQDGHIGSDGPSRSMARFAPVATILFALTVTFASVDLLMSLEPHWFSTMIGVYFFSGCAVASMSVWALATVWADTKGRLGGLVRIDHYHDIGKLLFGFNFFWAYIAFCQFMLIWYADIPEETFWYLSRQQGVWVWVAVALLVGHFVIPFLGLMSRHVKRNPRMLAFWAVWLLVMHVVDLVYWVAPIEHLAHAPIGWWGVALVSALAFLLMWLGGAMRLLAGQSVLPDADPLLAESLALHVE